MARSSSGSLRGMAAVIDRRESIRDAIILNNQTNFAKALDALAAVDEEWEQWYDTTPLIPDRFSWSDTAAVNKMVDAINARAKEIGEHKDWLDQQQTYADLRADMH